MTRFLGDPFTPVSRRGAPAPLPQPTGQAAGDEPRDPARMNKTELIAWADELGLSTKGTKTELVARIRAAV